MTGEVGRSGSGAGAVQSGVPVEDRKGPWAQEFHTLAEALVYLRVQFGNIDRVRRIVEEMNVS